MKFSIKDFFSKYDHICLHLDLVTFTEEILNRKLHFLRSDQTQIQKIHKKSVVVNGITTYH